MPETKLPCRINRRYDGIAHIVETAYRGRPVWYGSIDVACDWDEIHKLVDADLVVELEDGRAGFVRTTGCTSQRVEVAVDGKEPGETCLLYFVGVSQLVVPRTRAQASPTGETVITATRTIIRSNDGKTPL